MIHYPDKTSLPIQFNISLHRRGKQLRLDSHERAEYYNQLMKFHMLCIIKEIESLNNKKVILHHLNHIFLILYHQFFLYSIKTIHRESGMMKAYYWNEKIKEFENIDTSHTKKIIQKYLTRYNNYKYRVIFNLNHLFPNEITKHIFEYL